MRTIFISVVAVFCTAFQQMHAQDEIFCGTRDTSAIKPFERVQQMINTTMNLALVFADFQDGRKPDGSLPTVDADTVYFTGDSIDAVGGMGYVKVGTPFVWKKRIRKYAYEDYWDWMFSDSTYVGNRHPDNQSHEIEVFGSVKDYYKEVSYNNLTITPAQTWTFPPNNYRQGIINAIDTANGRRFVRWILLPHPKTYYYNDGGASLLVGDLDSTLRARHSLPVAILTTSISLSISIGTNAS